MHKQRSPAEVTSQTVRQTPYSLSCGKEDTIMEKYEALEMEVIRFEAEDVICESQR